MKPAILLLERLDKSKPILEYERSNLDLKICFNTFYNF